MALLDPRPGGASLPVDLRQVGSFSKSFVFAVFVGTHCKGTAVAENTGPESLERGQDPLRGQKWTLDNGVPKSRNGLQPVIFYTRVSQE